MIDTAHLSDLQVLACTLYGEARSEPTEGILAVACVIRNRVKDPSHRWRSTYRQVCLQPKQFSVWNDGPLEKDGVVTNHGRLAKLVDALKTKASTDALFKECAWVATGVFNDWTRDVTFGSDHYHLGSMKDRPDWAKGMVPMNNLHKFPRTSHLFYHLIPIMEKARAKKTA